MALIAVILTWFLPEAHRLEYLSSHKPAGTAVRIPGKLRLV